MDTFTISKELTNAIIQYMGARPWVEAAAIMSGIQNELASQGLTITLQAPETDEQPS